MRESLYGNHLAPHVKLPHGADGTALAKPSFSDHLPAYPMLAMRGGGERGSLSGTLAVARETEDRLDSALSNTCSILVGMASWHETEPRAVWILRPGQTPLPAWPGLLVAWMLTDERPPTPPQWMGLVAFSRAGALMELRWCYRSELQPIAEEPPICGG